MLSHEGCGASIHLLNLLNVTVFTGDMIVNTAGTALLCGVNNRLVR